MENLQLVPAGQQALVLAARFDPSAEPLVVSVFSGDVAGAKTAGWASGVWCAQRRLNSDTNAPMISVSAAMELAASPGEVRHSAMERTTLEGDDLRPTGLAGAAITQVEASTQQMAMNHRGSSSRRCGPSWPARKPASASGAG